MSAFNPGSSFFYQLPHSVDVPKSSENISTQILASLYLPFKDIGNIPYSHDPKAIFKLEDKVYEVPDPKVNPAYYFMPNGFSVSLYGSPGIWPTHNLGGGAFSYGVAGIIELPQNRSLEIGAEILNLKFEIKDDPVGFARFPITDPNDPTDILHELKGNFSYLQIPIMMRQRFGNNNRFKPMISAGFVAYQLQRQEFVYEYLNLSGEYKLENTIKDGNFSADNLRIGLGASYSFGKRWSTALEVQYQHGFSLNELEYFKLRFWGVQLGVNYKIK